MNAIKRNTVRPTGLYSHREIFKIAFPILVSLLMEQMIGMTDTAFLGRVGEVELGASAIAGIYYLSLFMVGFGFSVGAQILMARRNGEGHFEEVGGIQELSGLAGIWFFLFVCSRDVPCLFYRYNSDENAYVEFARYGALQYCIQLYSYQW